ncbi:hypothetical protein POTOM_036510 [Populus tomentosa]|uniref:Protease Do-like PDZ domain-containing protein n=1 Tax=Populus tomentosa TaxID=118781 RepID=A0A8X8CF39_POPTO|nr:hypothetical protein POTOM_036510 [Populus tomentosa]
MFLLMVLFLIHVTCPCTLICNLTGALCIAFLKLRAEITFDHLVSMKKPNEIASVRVFRGGEEHEFSITLRPARFSTVLKQQLHNCVTGVSFINTCAHACVPSHDCSDDQRSISVFHYIENQCFLHNCLHSQTVCVGMDWIKIIILIHGQATGWWPYPPWLYACTFLDTKHNLEALLLLTIKGNLVVLRGQPSYLVLMDDINAGYERLAELQGPQRCWFGHEEQSRHAKMLKCRAVGPVSVKKVNGLEVDNLKHLCGLVEDCSSESLRFDLDDDSVIALNYQSAK